LPEVEPRCVVVISKLHPTPPTYPRAIGVPTKRPLWAVDARRMAQRLGGHVPKNCL